MDTKEVVIFRDQLDARFVTATDSGKFFGMTPVSKSTSGFVGEIGSNTITGLQPWMKSYNGIELESTHMVTKVSNNEKAFFGLKVYVSAFGLTNQYFYLSN